MEILSFAFLVGIVSGLRALTGVAVLSWAARFHRIHLEDTPLAFLSFAATPYVFTCLALGELINDKLPKTPSRTVPPQFIARAVMGSLAGGVVGLQGNMPAFGVIAGLLGSVAGTLGGARARHLLAEKFGKDLPAALMEDCIAIVLAIVVATHIGV